MANIKFVTTRDLLGVSFQKVDLQDINLPQDCCLDLETTGLVFNRDKILLVVLGNKDVQYVVDYLFVDRELLKKKLSGVSTFIGHNLSFDIPFLINEGFKFSTSQIYDTLETELTLIKGTKESVSLLNTTKRRLNIEPYDKGLTILFTYLSKDYPLFTDSLIEYAATDILHLEDIREEQMKYIKKYGQEELVKTNNDMVVVCAHMKVRGMKINTKAWMKLYYDNLAKCEQLELLLDQELFRLGIRQKERRRSKALQTDLFGEGVVVSNKNVQHINYSSTDQIREIFRHFKQPIPRVTKKEKGKQKEKETTGTKELEEYLLMRPDSMLKDFIKLLIDYRTYQKRVTTYGKSFLDEHLADDGRIHPDFKINRTATGRLSSNNPNAQNIPKVEEYRSCFQGEGTNKIFTCDLSSAELRILASLSGDETLKRLYKDGEDLHSYLAQPAFRYLKNDPNLVVSKKVNGHMRDTMKIVNFSIVYGSSATKVGKILNVSKEQGQKVLDIMKDTIPKAFEFLEHQEWAAKNVGKIVFEPKWNQVRYFEKVLKKGTVDREGKLIKPTQEELAAIGREGKNCAIQGVNSQQVKVGLVKIFEYLREHNLKSTLICTVHDEVVIEVVEGEEDHCKAYQKIMEESSDYFLDGVNMVAEWSLKEVWSK